jgi:hypothetical protein
MDDESLASFRPSRSERQQGQELFKGPVQEDFRPPDDLSIPFDQVIGVRKPTLSRFCFGDCRELPLGSDGDQLRQLPVEQKRVLRALFVEVSDSPRALGKPLLLQEAAEHRA